MTNIPPKSEVSPRKLREIFNEGRYVARAFSGELQAVVTHNRHPSAPRAKVPFCTRSQIITYLDRNGDEVALAHQYLQPDGTLGASGLPDPKRVFKDGILYVAWWEPHGDDR